MDQYADILRMLRAGTMVRRFGELYGRKAGVALTQTDRYSRLVRRFADTFGDRGELRFFSAPGRTEIGGNHTDHNNGQVLAAAITLDAVAAVTPTDNGLITLYSEGYETPFIIDTADTQKRDEPDSCRLIRGIVERLKQLGKPIGGFNGYMTSNVLGGSGLSSSACFEVLVVAILDGLYGGMKIDPIERAVICQWSENNYMDKPSGLMDQTASSRGGMVNIDFGTKTPAVRALDVDFAQYGYSLTVVATDSSHDDLTAEYASMPVEMKAVAKAFGAETLRGVRREQVLDDLPRLRKLTSDRAVMRALHFFDENERVEAMVSALMKGDVHAFFAKIIESGESSWKLLQNIYVPGQTKQALALALELSRRILAGQGAWRVHGGGFAGTILAFVPDHLLADYTATMNGVFGDRACAVLDTRAQGAIEVIISEE